MDNKKLAGLLFPNIDKTPEYYEEKYPERGLEKGAMVTRLAPSPTGFIHLGNLFGAVVDERLASQSGGVFILRIEDTDAKREVEGAVELTISTMKHFGIEFTEGATSEGETGEYGPYRQRQRKDIYQAFAKYLVEQGKAYPCFCTEQDLEDIREQQKEAKIDFGYYGEWAKHRDMPLEEIEKNLAEGKEYVLRFRSEGKKDNYVKVLDGIRGEIEVPENIQDVVILKSDGIPTYHFAHAIDDHLMRVTHVVRAEEWLSTLPIHVQLFDALGFDKPLYCHTAQLMKVDNGNKRKLSKRKDPELGLDYYRQEGYTVDAVWEYLLTILNSNYEAWRDKNPDADRREFKFTTDKMTKSGTLFDIMKLNNISKDVIAKMTAEQVYEGLSGWAKEYDEGFHDVISRAEDKTIKILNMGRNAKKPRKDIVTWSQCKEFIKYFYNEYFEVLDEYPGIPQDKIKKILTEYIDTYNHADEKNDWFEKVKVITESAGYTTNTKEYKEDPEKFGGSIIEVTTIIRIALTGKANAPDIWEIQQILGKEDTMKRMQDALNKL
ncbi:MAG: glutamate--tRNA ligase [Clostridia bacterium]|nr:glutamate--tRNA ligase [Clostridia bacterium]